MSVEDDLETLISAWRELSWSTRIVAVAFFVVSLLPLASLGDQVIELRGFLLHGVEFYRSATESLLEAIRKIGIEVPRYLFDLIVLLLLHTRVNVASFRVQHTFEERTGYRFEDWRIYAFNVIDVGVMLIVIAVISQFLKGMPFEIAIVALAFMMGVNNTVHSCIGYRSILPAVAFVMPFFAVAVLAQLSVVFQIVN